jgi:hypothetical protein
MRQDDRWHGRLYCEFFWVDARVSRQNGNWIASVDSPHGPTLAAARTALSALAEALEPFEGVRMELLDSAPPELVRLLES